MFCSGVVKEGKGKGKEEVVANSAGENSCCSVPQSCLTLCNPMDCSRSGFPVLQYCLEFVQTHGQWVDDVIQPSHPVTPFYSCPQSFMSRRPWSSFPVSQLFASGGQSIGASASASVLPMSIQGWFPLALTGLISCARDSKQPSSEAQIESISSALSLLCGPTLTSVHDYWKNHSFDYMEICQQSDVSAF